MEPGEVWVYLAADQKQARAGQVYRNYSSIPAGGVYDTLDRAAPVASSTPPGSAAPVTTAVPTAAPSVAPTVAPIAVSTTRAIETTHSGGFVRRSHPAKGTAVVLGNGSPQRFLRLENDFATDNGPDLYATILDYAGVEVPVGRRGLSLRSLVAAEPSVWRDALCVETLFDGGRGYDTQGRALIAGWDKYVLYDRGRYREQLFNLETDPGEMVNLAVQDRHRGTLERCRALLREQLAQTGDRFTGL